MAAVELEGKRYEVADEDLRHVLRHARKTLTAIMVHDRPTVSERRALSFIEDVCFVHPNMV